MSIENEVFVEEKKSIPPIKWALPLLVLFLVIALDQWLKYWVKHHMILHTERPVFGKWFILHFTENEGMAFGMKFFGENGKLILSILRIGVAIFGFWVLFNQIRKHAKTAFLVCIALILGGALGNIIDCIFYGVWYQSINLYQGGYLHGWVVDMLYFPIINTYYPSWSPYHPGQEFIFFSPVFNLADTAISTGVIAIIVFQKRFFKQAPKPGTEINHSVENVEELAGEVKPEITDVPENDQELNNRS